MPWFFYRWLLFFCISITMINGFFLRHTSSGKCITAANTAWNDKYGDRNWAKLLDCLNVNAQLRYLQGSETLHNIARKGVVTMLGGGRYKQRMVIYNSKTPSWKYKLMHSMKQRAAGSLYFYHSSRDKCAEPDSNEIYIIEKACDGTKEQQKFTFGSVTQFGNKMKDVHCSPIQRMLIHKAHCGDFNNSGSFNANATIDNKCSQRASCQVKSLCDGNRSCELTVDNNLLSSQYCPDTANEIYIEYTCVDNYMNPLKSAPNIRLSKSPSEGFIEIKNASTWRIVKEEIWDINREKSLCQHLGFNGTLGSIVKTEGVQIGQKIASGDLCYDAPLKDVHLYPSTTTSTTDVPYVTCKICEHALLQNKAKFSDAIFSGSGSTGNTKYKEARFSSEGWCPTELGDKYLKIDLINEYHITRVMVMGDKDQTKWSGSYSLKYSHDESLVDSNRAVQINGNQNGYEASATDIDIYNVRYIKLKSNESADFCLRIEVCGEVQTPAPVQTIVAEPSFYSVNLSWTIPVVKNSSIITHFIIYLNGIEGNTISRAQYGNHYILRGLKPNNYYKVGIKTQDGSSEKSMEIFKSFETKKAGFFLRHTQSRKCIAVKTPGFNVDYYAARYWAEMVPNCLGDTALFRYLDSNLLHNIETEGNVVSEYSDDKYHKRLFVYDGKTQGGRDFANKTKHRIKQTSGGSLSLYQLSYCIQPSSGRYVDVKDSLCSDTAKQKITFGAVIQFGERMKYVHCAPIQRMVIHKAHYGDFNNSGTFDINAAIDKKCSRQASCQVKSLCGGNRSCELTIDNNLLSPYCSDTKKELYIEYTCVDNYMNPITKAPNIRLSKSPSEGFIEIKIGSTWRKVKEEIWDITREKSLCHHFGFNGTLGSVSKTQAIEVGQAFVSGDLCYDVPQNERCCVHLYPSITTTTVDAPYVTCKICENPLLQNRTKLPDAIFSGSGSTNNTTYKQARFSSDGWCPTESGDKYLKIDLPNEYHITRIMVMGDKNQTKWSESYSLKYSHDESLVDDSSEKQIKGNQNVSQISTTDVGIYNVRYIKIQSTGNTDFCLRIELCGEVQTPAKVTELIIKPSNYSAHLSWNIPGPNESSYITHYVIYLNGTEVRKISRAMYGSQYTLRGLEPYQNYIVGIQTQDGNSQNSLVEYKNFMTEEAVPGKPPQHLAFKSRNKSSLEITWKAPVKRFWNGRLTGYQICHSAQENDKRPECSDVNISSDLSFVISNLQPSTKYFVTVSAGTKVGFGNKSSELNKTTNGEPVNLTAKSYSSLQFNLSRPASYIKSVMVIVQSATNSPIPSENINTSKLEAQANTKDPYITAHLKASGDLPLTYVIGDGKEYKYGNETFINHVLQQNSSYIMFLKFIENQNSFYTTEWSRNVWTMAKPPAPNISKIESTGLKEYNISWSQPSLPGVQTVLQYKAYYGVLNVSRNATTSKETFVTIHVSEYDKQYTFEVQVETQAGKSDLAKKSWLTHSKPPNPPMRTDDFFVLILEKPDSEQNIKNVSLVIYRGSNNPPPLENLNLEEKTPADAKKNAVFVLRVFDIAEFKDGEIEVNLRMKKTSARKKRSPVNIEISGPEDATYRIAQRNTDTSGKVYWSYWTEPFSFKVTPPSTTTTTTTSTITTGSRTPSISTKIPKTEAARGDDNDMAAAIGASIGVILIVIVVVLSIIFLYRRGTLRRYFHKDPVDEKDIGSEMVGIENGGNDRHNEEVAFDDDIYSNQPEAEQKEHPSIQIAEFAHYVNEMKENDHYEFQKEYDDLPKNTNTSWEVSRKPFNKKKNRYGNIVTYDYCRVVLSGDEHEDYINASYIDGIKENSYIATQGPTLQTENDMWRMIWEQRCYSVVMVTSLVELGKPKCEKYWPDDGSKMYGNIEVTLMKTEEFAYHVTHTMRVTKDGEEREVRHYYFQSWPDHGVPKYPTQLLDFRRHYRTHHLQQSGPIVVHCSAGVGRTGVFLAIDTILDKLEKGVTNSVDVFGQVSAMRERRMNMVQTLEQYVFIHEAILETIVCGNNGVDSNKIMDETKNLSKVMAGGMTGFQAKFKILGEVSPKISDDECSAGLSEENYNKNRNKNVYPAESNRVPLPYLDGVDNSDYINAVFVHGYLGRNYFIATQSPLPATINDFWRLIHTQKSSTIVLLNNIKDGTSFPRFWPSERGKPTLYGSLTVQLDSEKDSDGIWTRKFILASYPDLSDGRVVNIFQYTKWPDHRVPQNGRGVISLTSLVEKSRQSHGGGPVIVACSDGAGRTGTYIAISNLLERMKIEQSMDVFQAIKIIRGTRPQFVENAEQYQFCYTALMAYLDDFGEYSNFE